MAELTVLGFEQQVPRLVNCGEGKKESLGWSYARNCRSKIPSRNDTMRYARKNAIINANGVGAKSKLSVRARAGGRIKFRCAAPGAGAAHDPASVLYAASTTIEIYLLI